MDVHAFENFTHSVGAARLLLKRAHEQGSLIEGLVLYAAAIDAVLRNLVALETGLRDGDVRHLDPRYFYHDDSKWMNERTVYAEAASCSVITTEELTELEELYRFRNIVIHRFIISEVTYAAIGPHLDKCETALLRLLKRLEDIEQPDGEELTTADRDRIQKRIADKFGEGGVGA